MRTAVTGNKAGRAHLPHAVGGNVGQIALYHESPGFELSLIELSKCLLQILVTMNHHLSSAGLGAYRLDPDRSRFEQLPARHTGIVDAERAEARQYRIAGEFVQRIGPAGGALMCLRE